MQTGQMVHLDGVIGVGVGDAADPGSDLQSNIIGYIWLRLV